MTIDKDISNTKPPKEYKTYMLSTCNNDYISSNGFMYPKKGFVYAKDWDNKPTCVNGLHGLLRGEGDPSYLSIDTTAIWQVLMVDSREVVYLVDKVKVPRAWVLLSGTKDKAIAKMLELGCSLCAFGVVTAGDFGTAIVGYRGTAIACYDGTAKAGTDSIAKVGNWGTAITGMYGTATAGDNGTAIAGHGGTANAGKWGTAITGYVGTAVAGEEGTIQIKYWDAKSFRHRTAIGYIGEKGLLPYIKYKVDETGKFYKVKKGK